LTHSVHTTRRCATPCETAGTSRTPSAMADHSSRYRLPHHDENLSSKVNRNNGAGAVAEPSHTLTGSPMLSSGAIGPRRTKGNRSSLIGRSWWKPTSPRPHIFGRNTPHIKPSRPVDQLRSPQQVPYACRPRDSRDPSQKVLVDGGSNINVTFPRTLQALGNFDCRPHLVRHSILRHRID
jgi:hypothetical protein